MGPITCELSTQHRPQWHTWVHRRGIRVGVCDTRDWHLLMLPMAVAIVITFYTTQLNYVCYGGCDEFTIAAMKSLAGPYTVGKYMSQLWSQIWIPVPLIYRKVEFQILEQRLQIVRQLCKGSKITPKWYEMASRYHSWLPLSHYHSWHLIRQPI